MIKKSKFVYFLVFVILVSSTFLCRNAMAKDYIVVLDFNANNVNAACNCVARINETIDTAIKAAKFLGGQ